MHHLRTYERRQLQLLSNNDISNASIVNLVELQSLRDLELYITSVTPDGFDRQRLRSPIRH